MHPPSPMLSKWEQRISGGSNKDFHIPPHPFSISSQPDEQNLNVGVSSDRRDPFMVLSGGLSYDTVGRRACLTVMHGKSTAVLEMDFPIVDFLTLCETPYPNGEPQTLRCAWVWPSALSRMFSS